VGNDVVVEDGCVILDGAVVADGVALELGSVVFPGLALDGGFLYAGIPAKPVRRIDHEEIARRAKLVRGRDDSPADRATAHQLAADSEIDDSVFIAATASVKGRIIAAKGSSIFFSNELDAGSSSIAIGEKTNIQDNTIIRCSSESFRIGRESTIGHNVLLHDCSIGDHSLVGIGSVVARGTIVGDHVLLAAGARTEEDQILESGFLYTGTPARKRALLDEAKREMIGATIWSYCHYANVFKAAQHKLSAAAATRA
jgi:gamma-carbonic anhydrase